MTQKQYDLESAKVSLKAHDAEIEQSKKDFEAIQEREYAKLEQAKATYTLNIQEAKGELTRLQIDRERHAAWVTVCSELVEKNFEA